MLCIMIQSTAGFHPNGLHQRFHTLDCMDHHGQHASKAAAIYESCHLLRCTTMDDARNDAAAQPFFMHHERKRPRPLTKAQQRRRMAAVQCQSCLVRIHSCLGAPSCLPHQPLHMQRGRTAGVKLRCLVGTEARVPLLLLASVCDRQIAPHLRRRQCSRIAA